MTQQSQQERHVTRILKCHNLHIMFYMHFYAHLNPATQNKSLQEGKLRQVNNNSGRKQANSCGRNTQVGHFIAKTLKDYD